MSLKYFTLPHVLSRSCYRGFAKVQRQNLFIASAGNIKRWLRIAAAAQRHEARAFLVQICNNKSYIYFSVYLGNTSFRRDPCIAWRPSAEVTLRIVSDVGVAVLYRSCLLL
jgi:hypothetical protein